MQKNHRWINRPQVKTERLKGVGLNLHLDHLRELQCLGNSIPYIEVIADNWLSPGPHHKLLEQIRADYPVYFHCVGSNIAGTDPISLDYLKRIRELADRFDVVHISDHLCVQQHQSVCFHDLLPFPLTEKWLAHCVDRVLIIQEALARSIAVENLSYYIEFSDSEMSESCFLNELSKSSHCGILLDLNNVWVNEKNLKLDAIKFIHEIDHDRILEIHLAGPELRDGIYVDTHGSDVRDDVLDYFSVLPRNLHEQVPVFYERDNHRPDLQRLIEHSIEIEQKINKVYG